MIRLETIFGHQYYLPEGRIPFQENSIKQLGIYEPATSAAIYKFLKPGMHVVEGGACCGYHALNIARAVGREGRVYCFEANPGLVGILKKNVEVNGYVDNVEIIHAGLWFEESELPFPMLNMGLGGASFKNPRQLAAVPTVPVRMISLDDMFSDMRIDFIRMDIEGAELEALKGAETILARQQPGMILEWIPENAGYGETIEMYNMLKKYGYQIYRITGQGLVNISRHEDLLNKHIAVHERDVLCCREVL